MSIDFRKFIDIVSGVAASAGVRTRDLIGRIFTQNTMVSPDKVYEFTSPDDVGKMFGTTSEEYKRAVFYFGWVSPVISAAKKLSFARFAPAGAAPRVFGNTDVKVLATLQAITAGAITFVLDGVAVTVSGLNFAAATTLADVASVVQTALNANANPQLATATVTYDATTRRFNFIGGVIAESTLALQAPGSGVTDAAAALGWYQADGALWTNGADVQTPQGAVAYVNNISDNYGSFLFLGSLTLNDHIAIAEYNAAQNVRFMYMVKVRPNDAASWCAALLGFAGTGVTVDAITATTEYPEMVPMIIQAATDYTRRNSATNYMYKQFALTPSVTETTDAQAYDAMRANYYGQTQKAGQNISFYQDGVLMGGATAPVDMNTFSNEAWLKDFAASRLMELMLALNRISANAAGRAQVLTQLQDVVDAGLFNGVISVGKALDSTQKLFITDQTGDDLAWHQVQDIGYWLDAQMVKYVTTDGRNAYKTVYTLIYSKDDAVRKVEGTHNLI